MKANKTSLSADVSDLDLDRYIPYLLNLAGGRIAFATARALRSSGNKYENWRVLVTLWHHGRLHMVEIARLANFELSTLSRLVARLEARGLVQRINEKGRARTLRIDLTPKGSALVSDSLPVWLQHERNALAGFTAGERILLQEMLQRICRNVDRHAILED